ncbi:putative aminohydrolase SsnA [Candidatus Sumerlaeota bacterium]|nr:putative aminohydrolase SsnA [Candidatus Sumerlaeota bacterium]
MIIHNATILTMNDEKDILNDGAILIDGDSIRDMGTSGEMLKKYLDAKKLDANGKILMPGYINAHTHLYSAFARGIALKDKSPEKFSQILERLWWRLDRALDEESIAMSAVLFLIQAVKSGVTTLVDHHSSPYAIKDSLDIIASQFERTGLRGILCYEVSDRDGEGACKQGIEENIRFLEKCRKEKSALLGGLFGLHASFTLSDNTLKACVEAAGDFDAGFHTHCAEARSDLEDAQRRFGKTVAQRFGEAGVLGQKSIAAHCVHITPRDMDILKETKTNVVHNPRSNMNNAVGCAPVLEMMRKGVCVGLGTDGMNARMTDELRVFTLLHKHEKEDSRVAFSESYDILFKNNALMASRLFGRQIGVIQKDAVADLILVDYYPPTPLNPENISGHILFGIIDAPVDTTIAGGRILMHKKEIPGIDEAEISREALEIAKKVWERF